MIINSSIKNLVDEIHILNDSTFVSEILLQPPLASNSIFSKNINFEFDTFRPALYGGSFAIGHSCFSENTSKIISIYDPSLNFLRNIEISESIHDFYFTPDEMLVVVFNTPAVAVYDQRGNQILYKYLSDQQEFIVASAFWEHGVFIATFTGNVYHVYDFSKLTISNFATDEQNIPNITSGIALPPKSGVHGPVFWGIMPFGKNQELSKLICVQKNNVKAIEYGERILQVQYSSDFSMVMVLTKDSVDICDDFFRRINAKLVISSFSVLHACWCGSSTILITTSDGLKMIGQANKPCNFNISSDCCVITDIDGARVVTRDNITYIREASGVALDFIQNNVNSPSIKLFSAVSVPEDFAKSDPLEVLRDVMDKAINGLLEASKFFRKPSFVKQLLGIVARYKLECKNYKCDTYLQVLSNYRIISQLSQKPVNMPLTVAQLSRIGSERLVIRLCNRYLHFVASKIAESLNLQNETIVGTHWAHCLIFSKTKSSSNSSNSSNSLSVINSSSSSSIEEILRKLRPMESTIDRVELANCAFDLAARLTDYEQSSEKEKLALALLRSVPSKSRTIPLLIKRGEWSDAVEAAVESNDSSLLLYVLKSATDRNQGEIVRDCITRHLIALDGWLRLHPDEPQRAELLEKSGFLRDSLFFRFQKGQPIESLAAKAKENGDALDLECFQAVATIKNACREFGVAYEPNITAYDIFDKVAETRQSKMIKSAAKMLKMQPDEVITRRIEVANKLGIKDMIEEAAKDATQEVLYDTFMNLMDDNKREYAVIIQKYIKEDDYMTPRIMARLSE